MLPFDLLSSAIEQISFSVLCAPVDTDLFGIRQPMTLIRNPCAFEQNSSLSLFVYCSKSEHILSVTCLSIV